MHFLVDFNNNTQQEQINQYLQDNNCTVLKQFSHWDKVYHVSADIMPPKTEIIEYVINDTESAMQLLSTTTLPGADETVTFDMQDEKNWWKVATLWDVDFSQNEITNDVLGKNVSVYVMDSGIDITHPEFVGRDVQLFHSFDGTFDDLSGHGTAIASLISGNTCGLTNAKIKVVKILNEGQITTLSQLLTAFDSIISDLPNTHYAVVNMSWCVPRNEYLDAKIQSMVRQNFVMVAAAGNNGGPIEDITPAAIPEVITIGSYDENFEPCDFSAYTGSEVSVTANKVNHGELDGWAPGQNLWVARPGGGYGYVAGTSFSAAIHSGSLAYVIDCDWIESSGEVVPCLTNDVVIMAETGSLSRKNILNLTGNYTQSVNQISTISGASSPVATHVYWPERLALFANENTCRHLVARREVASITFDKALPAGMILSETGYLYGFATLGPNDPDYIIENYTVTLVMRSGETKQNSLTLSWCKSGLDTSTIPVDQGWVIEVLGVACGPLATCDKQCPAGGFSATRLCCLPKGDPVCELCVPFLVC